MVIEREVLGFNLSLGCSFFIILCLPIYLFVNFFVFPYHLTFVLVFYFCVLSCISIYVFNIGSLYFSSNFAFYLHLVLYGSVSSIFRLFYSCISYMISTFKVLTAYLFFMLYHIMIHVRTLSINPILSTL